MINLISITDHTNLNPTSTFEDIKSLIDDAVKYGAWSVCIPPSIVKKAREYNKDVVITTVVGFPLGYNLTDVKVLETKKALEDGADEIDMVINQMDVKDKNYESIENEIRDVKSICKENVLKVIVETCNMTKEELIILTKVVEKAGADFIKTSTGFAKDGAKIEDVRLFKSTCPNLKVKAAGGIKSIEDAVALVEAGADRLGSSKIIGLVRKSGDR